MSTDTPANSETIAMADFLNDYGPALMAAVNEQNPPRYQGKYSIKHNACLDQLKRQPFDLQSNAIHAVHQLLTLHKEPAAVINGEMGTGKTMMSICVAKLLHDDGYPRTLVVCPPHLVYKWRREILETVPDARVTVLNGADTLIKLIRLKEDIAQTRSTRTHATAPEFFVMGRVRMRMGFNWTPAVAKRIADHDLKAACPDCGHFIADEDGNYYRYQTYAELFNDKRRQCDQCGSALWTNIRRAQTKALTKAQLVEKAMCQIPTIGPKTAERLINTFGVSFIENMLSDNLYEFINLMDEDGELVFSDKQATRMERAMANMEFGLGQGHYQPSEYIKPVFTEWVFWLDVS